MTINGYSLYWDQTNAFDALLFERLDEALGGSLVCDFGVGSQGHAFLDDRDRIVKATRSAEEAALSAYLASHPLPGFAVVEDVHRIVIDEVPMFVIRREFVRDLIDDPSPEASAVLQRIKEAWTDIWFLGKDVESSAIADALQIDHPQWLFHLMEFKLRMRAFTEQTGIYVADLHLENIGFGGRLRVRDPRLRYEQRIARVRRGCRRDDPYPVVSKRRADADFCMTVSVSVK